MPFPRRCIWGWLTEEAIVRASGPRRFRSILAAGIVGLLLAACAPTHKTSAVSSARRLRPGVSRT